MVPVKDPNLKGVGFSFRFLPLVSWFFRWLVGTWSNGGKLCEQSTDLQKSQQKMVEVAGIETRMGVSRLCAKMR
ncbi:MAG: hypothetical protein RJB04_497 [Verrucomicrobiota bacterium]